MRRLYGVNDERTQMGKIRYLQMKDDTQRLICSHCMSIMKIMFNHIKRLMMKQEQKVTLGQKKEMIRKGITSEGKIFSQQEMSVEIKKMKENKAADESGVIAEYLKTLEVEEVEKLRGLMDGILNGADIPKEWKESRVKLLKKGGRTDELKTTNRSRK